MQDDVGAKLAVSWRFFSLEQINSKQGSEWKIWEQGEDYRSRGLRPFWAAEASRRQGEAAFDRFHIALFRAIHEQHRDATEMNAIAEIGESVDLDMNQFRHDLADRSLLTKLAGDHTFAVETLGVFGTPTLVFPQRQAIFVKMSLPPPEDSLSVFNELRHLVDRRRYIHEVKRPNMPLRNSH